MRTNKEQLDNAIHSKPNTGMSEVWVYYAQGQHTLWLSTH